MRSLAIIENLILNAKPKVVWEPSMTCDLSTEGGV